VVRGILLEATSIVRVASWLSLASQVSAWSDSSLHSAVPLVSSLSVAACVSTVTIISGRARTSWPSIVSARAWPCTQSRGATSATVSVESRRPREASVSHRSARSRAPWGTAVACIADRSQRPRCPPSRQTGSTAPSCVSIFSFPARPACAPRLTLATPDCTVSWVSARALGARVAWRAVAARRAIVTAVSSFAAVAVPVIVVVLLAWRTRHARWSGRSCVPRVSGGSVLPQKLVHRQVVVIAVEVSAFYSRVAVHSSWTTRARRALSARNARPAWDAVSWLARLSLGAWGSVVAVPARRTWQPVAAISSLRSLPSSVASVAVISTRSVRVTARVAGRTGVSRRAGSSNSSVVAVLTGNTGRAPRTSRAQEVEGVSWSSARSVSSGCTRLALDSLPAR